MNSQNADRVAVEGRRESSPHSIVENVLEKRLEDIVTILSSERYGKSRLYEQVLSMFERIMIKIALRRSNYIKSAAAEFLGINRNTLHKKIEKFGISVEKD